MKKTRMKKTTIILFILIVFTACKIKEIFVPVIETKIEYKDKLRVDCVYNRDTLYLFTKNDTVYLQSVKWRERFRRDTVSVVKVDSIPYKVEVVKEVNILTKWQQIRLKALNIIVLIIILTLGIYIFLKVKR